MDFFIPRVLYWQLFVTPQLPRGTFDGQTIIVTGANAGLGLECARHLVKMGAKKTIIACRTVSKGEAAKADIERSTSRAGSVDVWELDLSSYASVKAFAARANTLDRLDAIIENAGINTKYWKITEQDESTITTNVTSTFLLALLILPKLRESASKFNITPRLSIVASEVHYSTDLKKEASSPSIFEYLNNESKTSMGFPRYSTSKLMEVLYCRELAPKLNTSGKPTVTLNYVNPGLCWSNLAEKNFAVNVFMTLLARKTDVGARCLVAGAMIGKESHGQFMTNAKIHE